jgi:hypothetical protein
MRRRRSAAAGQETKVALLTRELNQAVEQQAATAKVLQVISSSTFYRQTVLNALVKAGMHLCEADSAAIWRPEDGVLKCASCLRCRARGQRSLAHVASRHGPVTP